MTSICLVMWIRKQHRLYPIFWAFLCFQIVWLASEFICKTISYKAFFYSYWTGSFLNLILQLLLLRDIFSRTLIKYPQLDKFRRFLFETALFVSLASISTAVLMGNKIHTISKMTVTVELVISVVEVMLFIFVAASAVVLGIKWKSVICGIAAGLGVFGTVNVAAFILMLFSARLTSHVAVASWLNTVGYDVGIGIFCWYFLPKREEVALPQKIRPELLDWAESMRGSLPR